VPACPDLNSRTEAAQRTLLEQFLVSAQACLSGLPLTGIFRTDCPGRFARTQRMRSVRKHHTMKTRSDQTLVQDLRELIAALDRRLPRIEREGERAIARDAQGLKRAALKRIGELERLRSPEATRTARRETA